MKYISDENMMETTVNLHVSHFNNIENSRKKEFFTREFLKLLLFIRGCNI